jgi:hypothetical protein
MTYNFRLGQPNTRRIGGELYQSNQRVPAFHQINKRIDLLQDNSYSY